MATRNPYLKFHFVGLGGTGCNVVEGIYAKGIQAKFTCITEPKRPHLPQQIQFVAFPSLGNVECKLPSGIPNMSLPLHLSGKIKEIFSENDTYILFTGLGGYTGTKMVEQLIPWLRKHHKGFVVCCSIPFVFEGERRDIALRLVDQFRLLPNFHHFDLESVREKYRSRTIRATDEEFWTLFKKIFPEIGEVESLN